MDSNEIEYYVKISGLNFLSAALSLLLLIIHKFHKFINDNRSNDPFLRHEEIMSKKLNVLIVDDGLSTGRLCGKILKGNPGSG